MKVIPLKEAFRTPPADRGNQFEDAGVMAWQCGCGSCRFILRSDGKAECGGCGDFPPYKVEKIERG